MKPKHSTPLHLELATLRLGLDVDRIPGDRLAAIVDAVRRHAGDDVVVVGLHVEPVAIQLAGPRASLHALRAKAPSEGLRRALGGWEASYGPVYGGPRPARRSRWVLVVDGDPERARETVEALGRARTQAFAVGSIGTAQVMLQGSELVFDAVVLRHALADGEGLALLERVDVAERGCSVLVVDDEVRPALALEYRRRGAFRYIGPPASMLQLVSRVHSTLVDTQAWRRVEAPGREEPGEPPRVLVDPEHGAKRLQHLCRLSPMEREVAMMVLLGRRDLEIAEMLGQSERTAKRYVGRVLEKAGIQNRTSLWGVLYQDGLGSLSLREPAQVAAPRVASPVVGQPPSRPPAPSSLTTWSAA